MMSTTKGPPLPIQDILHSINDPTASGRNSLGQSLTELAKGIVQTMNGRYGDNFIFAGADGLKVPFTWERTAPFATVESP